MWYTIYFLSIWYFKYINGKCQTSTVQALAFEGFNVEFGQYISGVNDGMVFIVSYGDSYDKYTCPTGTTMGYIKSQEDYNDWKGLRGLTSEKENTKTSKLYILE